MYNISYKGNYDWRNVLFTQETLTFLENIAENNNREWFTEHKQEYLDYVQAPTRALAAQLEKDMLDFDPFMLTDPKRVCSRIYRDTRFSSDKTPYKTTSYLIYRRPMEDKTNVPGWFFEVNATGYCYGMGAFNANAKFMANFRLLIDEDPERFLSIIGNINRRRFDLYTEEYKRPIPNDLDKKIQPYYQSKNFYLICNKSIDKTLFSNRLAPTIVDGFMQLKLLYDFLWQTYSRAF